MRAEDINLEFDGTLSIEYIEAGWSSGPPVLHAEGTRTSHAVHEVRRLKIIIYSYVQYQFDQNTVFSKKNSIAIMYS